MNPLTTDSRKKLKSIGLLIKATISFSLISIIFSQIEIKEFKNVIYSVNKNFIPIVFIIFLAQVGFAAKRWCYVLKGLNLELSFRTSLRLVMLGQFFNQCLPSNIGGDAMRIYYLRRENIGTHSAINSVLLDRIMGLAVLVALSTIALPLITNHFDNQLAITALTALICLGWIAVLLLFLLDNSLLHRFRSYRLMSPLFELSKSARALLSNRNMASGILSMSLLIHMSSVGIVWAIDKALGGNASFTIYLMAMMPTLLIVSIPISIAGWGVREQTLVTILGGMGITSSHAFSVSILFGVVLILGSLPGAYFWLRTSRREKST